MKKRILVTGGAGFIGSFLVDRLILDGHEVTILDSLVPQVHHGKKPEYLNPQAQFIHGDVCDKEAVEHALKNVSVIYHLASRVGVAQSNYEIEEYVSGNVTGMATILDVVVKKKLPIEKILMTASMTSYGEGDYECSTCGKVKPQLRVSAPSVSGSFEPNCPICGGVLRAIATNESSLLTNNSVYSLTKYMQEQILFHIGEMYKIPVVSLRCFNVYGPRQSLSNPYTGVAAIFISRLKNGSRPVVYEDGRQTRDFISVHDVVDVLLLALENEKVNFQKMNIGSGKAIAIADVARKIATLLSVSIEPEITMKYRANDIRHCFADTTLVRQLLGWTPKISFETGMKELIEWSKSEKSVDNFTIAEKELQSQLPL